MAVPDGPGSDRSAHDSDALGDHGTPEDRVKALMANLERSVADAKAARDRKRQAERDGSPEAEQ